MSEERQTKNVKGLADVQARAVQGPGVLERFSAFRQSLLALLVVDETRVSSEILV
jgi:hypothetical protein